MEQKEGEVFQFEQALFDEVASKYPYSDDVKEEARRALLSVSKEMSSVPSLEDCIANQQKLPADDGSGRLRALHRKWPDLRRMKEVNDIILAYYEHRKHT